MIHVKVCRVRRDFLAAIGALAALLIVKKLSRWRGYLLSVSGLSAPRECCRFSFIIRIYTAGRFGLVEGPRGAHHVDG